MIDNLKQAISFLKRIGKNTVGSDFSFINSSGTEEAESPWKDVCSEAELGSSSTSLEKLVEKMMMSKQ